MDEEVKDDKESKAGTASKKATPMQANETPAVTPQNPSASHSAARSKVLDGQKSLANLTASQGSRGSLNSKEVPGADPFAFNIDGGTGLGSEDKDEIMGRIDEVQKNLQAQIDRLKK